MLSILGMLNFPFGSFTLVTVICDTHSSPWHNVRRIFYSISTRVSQFFFYHVLSPGLLFLLTSSRGYLLLPLPAATSTFFYFSACVLGPIYVLEDFPSSFFNDNYSHSTGSQMGCLTHPREEYVLCLNI